MIETHGRRWRTRWRAVSVSGTAATTAVSGTGSSGGPDAMMAVFRRGSTGCSRPQPRQSAPGVHRGAFRRCVLPCGRREAPKSLAVGLRVSSTSVTAVATANLSCATFAPQFVFWRAFYFLRGTDQPWRCSALGYFTGLATMKVTGDFYEILSVAKDASAEELKKVGTRAKGAQETARVNFFEPLR